MISRQTLYSLISWRAGEIWDSVLSLLLKMVFQIRRQVEGVTSHSGQRRGGLINFNIMGSAKSAILQDARVVWKGRGRSCSLSWWRELVPLCEPDKGCGQLPWQFLDGYEQLERCIYSLLECCVQRGLNRQAVDRLAFTTGWRYFDWGSVIFSDETSISSDCESRGHVYREPGTRYELTISNEVRDRDDLAYHAGAGCHMLVLVCLERIHGRFNVPQYQHILENVVQSEFEIPKEI